MFGYVKPDEPNLYVKDVALYKATYCGLCKSISRGAGQVARLCLNYDLSFLSNVLHNVMGIDVTIHKEHCILHPLKKRPIAAPDELSVRIGLLNVLLAYQKADDDVYDEKKGRGKRLILKRAAKRAKQKEPTLFFAVKNGYEKIFAYENKKGDSPIVVSEFFGEMLVELVKELAKDAFSDALSRLMFSLGKWIYLADALDDYDKDFKKGNYNPFIYAYPEITRKDDLLSEKREEIAFLFGDILYEIHEANENVSYKFNHDLIDNVFYKGLRAETKRLTEVSKK